MSLSLKRLTITGFVLTSLVFGEAIAGTACRTSPAHEAFNVQGLKSELMVTALSCNAQDKYNEFVTKFRPILASQESKLNSYFRSTYSRGKAAQRAHDDYITQLANVQSSQGLKAGTIFCRQRVDMFDEVNFLNTSTDLSQYAEAKDIVQPASFEVCSAPSTKRHSTIKRRNIHHRKSVQKK